MLICVKTTKTWYEKNALFNNKEQILKRLISRVTDKPLKNNSNLIFYVITKQ